MNRAACAGHPVRGSPARRTTIVANASGTAQAAGWASSTAPSRRCGAVEQGRRPRRRRSRTPPTSQPGERADVGQPAPPDAEHQQRAERRRGHRERQADGPGDADVAGWRAPAGSGTVTATTAASRKAVTPRSRRPITSWVITPATAIVSPDEVDRNAANAPAVTSAGEQVAAEPADHRRRQLEHHASVRPLRQVGGVEPAERAVHRRQQVEEAEQRQHHERRPPGGPAVGVGVEAHHHVRQAHGAEEGRDDQRVRRVERVAAAVAERLRPDGVAVAAVTGVGRVGRAVAEPDDDQEARRGRAAR